MPDQVVPITQLDQTGVILDTPPVALPPNAFTNARNVRFKDGAIRKMEGEVDIFAGMSDFFAQSEIGQVEYLAWWPSPNQTVRDAGYYIFVVERFTTNAEDATITVHDVYAMLPGATFDSGQAVSRPNHYHRIGLNFSSSGKWQHTLFNGGFTFIINNGIQKPQYVTEATPSGDNDPDIQVLTLADLPGWDSYEVNEILLRDTYESAVDSNEFDTGQLRVSGQTQYVVTVERPGQTVDPLVEGTGYTISQSNNQDVITFADSPMGNTDANRPFLLDGDTVQVNFQSVEQVVVRAAIVRAFGDFLVAGNLVERDSNDNIIRRLTGVVRTSDVAQPGSIPNNWNPFAAGVSTADEFVIADTGTVQDMVPLQGNMYLYTNTSISAMRLTGNATVPLTVQPVTDQYGALTTDAVVEYDGKHFVIGSDDIYLFGGHPGSIQSISDQKVRRAFLERINPINDNVRNLFTLRYAARDEIWICFPTINSVRGESDEAYIWNYRNNTWTIRTLNSVIRGDVAPVPGGGVPSASLIFSGESGTNGVARLGSYEVQSFDLDSSARIGPVPTGQNEIQEFTAYDRALGQPTGAVRPAITTNAAEEIRVTIENDFDAGPDDTPQVNRVTIGDSTFRNNVDTNGNASDILYGGARLQFNYDATTDTNPSTGGINITANDLFESATSLNESGVGDNPNVFGTGVSITSIPMPRDATTITGSDSDNPPANNIGTTQGFNNAVSNSSPGPTTVAPSVGGSFPYDSNGSTTGPTRNATFTDGRAANGSVSATISNADQVDERTSQTVVLDWVNPGSTGLSTLRNGGRLPQVPAGTSIVMSDGTVYGPGRGLALSVTGPAGGGIPQAHINELFGTNGQNLTANGTRSATWIGGGTWSVTAPWAGGQIYSQAQPGASDPPPIASLSWSTRGALVGQINVQSAGVVAGDRSWSIARGAIGGITTRSTTRRRRLDSVTNNTNGPITFTWAGGNVTVPAGDTVTPGTIATDTEDSSWSFTGTGPGTTFTNTSGFEIRNFIPSGRTAVPILANSATTSVPILNATVWTGNTETIDVSNSNTTGEITWNGDTTGTVAAGAGGALLPAVRFLNHSQSWSYTGEADIVNAHIDITATRVSGNNITNFSVSAERDAMNTAIVTMTDPEPFAVGDTIELQLFAEQENATDMQLQDLRNSYNWQFSGTVQPSGAAPYSDATAVTEEEFVTAAASAINADRIPQLTDWTAVANGSSLDLTSTRPGMRPFDTSSVTYETYTAPATAIELTPPTQMGTQTINDADGLELFTVTVTGTEAPYNYVVSTSRNTGFPDSDIIRNFAIRVGNTQYPTMALPEFDSSSTDITFTANSNEWSIARGSSAPSYIALRDDEIILSETSSSMDVSDKRLTIPTPTPFQAGARDDGDGDGTYTQTDGAGATRTYGSPPVNRTIVVDVTSTPSTLTGQTVNFAMVDVTNTPSSDAAVNRFRWRLRPQTAFTLPNGTAIAANQLLTRAQMLNLLGTPSANNNSLTANWGTGLSSFFRNPAGSGFRNTITNIDRTGASNIQNLSLGSSRNTRPAWSVPLALTTPDGNGNTFGFVYTSNGDIVHYRNEPIQGSNDIFTEGARASTVIWSIPSNTNYGFRVGGLTVSSNEVTYDVTNNSTFPITFTPEGQTAGSVPGDTNTAVTFGPYTGTETRWSWNNSMISTGNQDGNATVNNIAVTVNTNTPISGPLFWRLWNNSDGNPYTGSGATATIGNNITVPFSANQARQVRLGPDQDRSNDTSSIYMFRTDGSFPQSYPFSGTYYRFNTARTDNSQDNFFGNGFSTDLTMLSHSAGAGNISRFNGNLQGNASGNTRTPTGIGGDTLSSSQQTAIQTFQRAVISGHAIGGPGIIYDNNVIVMWNTSTDRTGGFTGRHQFGQVYMASNTSGSVLGHSVRGTTSQPGTTFTVTNPHPFPISITPENGSATTILANTNTQNVGPIGGTGNDWSAVSVESTQYRHTVTNNNILPITVNSGTWGMGTLMPNNNLVAFTDSPSWTINADRRILSVDSTMVTGNSITQQTPGIGPVDNRMTVGYRFEVPFTDPSIPDIDHTYRFPNMADVGENGVTEDSLARLVAADFAGTTEINRYFEILNSDDADVPSGSFLIRARERSGQMFTPGDGGAMIEFPAHDATIFEILDRTTFGGNGNITHRHIVTGQSTNNPVGLVFRTGTNMLNPMTGEFTDVVTEELSVVLTGQFVAGDDADQTRGSNAIAEVYRTVFNNDALWSATRSGSVVTKTSAAMAPHTTRLVRIDDPNMPQLGLTDQFFNIEDTQQGITPGNAMTATFPSLTITFPDMQTQRVDFTVDTTALEAADIVSQIDTQMRMAGRSASNWTVQRDIDPAAIWGTGPTTTNRIKFVDTTARTVNTDNNPITFSIDYGNTGNTFPTGTTGATNIFDDDQFTRVTTPANFDFRGMAQINAEPTRIMVEITNPDYPEQTDLEGNPRIQYIPVTIGANSSYDPVTHMNSNGTRVIVTGDSGVLAQVRTAIRQVNRRVRVDVEGSRLVIRPVQFSGLANFVLDVFINDSSDNVSRWNDIVMNRMQAADAIVYFGSDGEVATNEAHVADARRRGMITVNNDMTGIQSYADAIAGPADTQANVSSARMPSRTATATVADLSSMDDINTVFDPLRPWRTDQVNLNREYPIFTTSILNDDLTLSQIFRGADLGFLYLDQQYESFVERIEMALTPEFDTEQIQSLALWADGGNQVTFGANEEQATLDVKLYGTNNPGETLGLYNNMPFNRNETTNRLMSTTMLQRTTDNKFLIGQDYKIDIRVHGRFLNLLISDFDVDANGMRVPDPNNIAEDVNLTAQLRRSDPSAAAVMRGISWNISGMQADVIKGGRR